MKPDLKALLKRLIQNDIDFVLVDGFACVVHGSSLVTQNIDIVITIDKNQVEGILGNLQG